jgi:hypothetical protein
MNIFVDPSLVSAILLQDGWHVVVPGTLNTGKYAVVEPNVPSPAMPGFTFHEEGGASIAGPMSSVLAVRRTPAARTTEVKASAAARPTSAPAPPAPARPQTAPTPPAAGSIPRDWWEP